MTKRTPEVPPYQPEKPTHISPVEPKTPSSPGKEPEIKPGEEQFLPLLLLKKFLLHQKTRKLHTEGMKKSSIYTIFDLKQASLPVQLINAVTLYRTIAFPFLVALIAIDRIDIFRWLLIVSFLTDLVDGYLARKFNATSVLGSKLDSIGDDLTILAAMIGLWVTRFDFIKSERIIFIVMGGLFLLQVIVALIRYQKISSFHTYLAKLAAILQGFFLCAMFLFDKPVYWLFYSASFITTLELVEEIIIVGILPEWKTDVKGLYWVIKSKNKKIH